ncbi:MAG: MFS transporter, partial [Mycobacteriales bacterium]
SALTGSFALAGAVAGTLTLSQATVAPAIGRLVDRRGQSSVIRFTLVINVLGTIGLILLAGYQAPLWTLFPAAVLAGVSTLPVGSLVRARWSSVAAGSSHLSSAYALESVLDEVIYVTGPMLVTALAVAVSPVAGLLGALALYVAGGAGLSVQRRTEPPTQEDGTRIGTIRSPGLFVLLVVYLVTGVFFGSFDIALIAFAKEHGAISAAGVLLALLAVGSLCAGMVFGVVRWQVAPERRLLFATLGLAVGAAPLAVADSVLVMAALTVVAGLAVSPLLISANSLVEVIVPRRSLTEGFAWLSGSITLGMALGSAVGGGLVDLGGSIAARLLAVGCAAVGFLTTLAGLKPMSCRNPDYASSQNDDSTLPVH